jgi:heme/copper-type cytochrome/quinol oxidase subunit 2
MKKIPLAQRAVALPLIGLMVAWALSMAAQYSDLFMPQPYYSENGVIYTEPFKLSVYLAFAAIAIGSIASLFSQTLAIRGREELGEENKLARAAHRFANLAVVLSLVIGTIFAIGTFMSSFNSYNGQGSDLGIHFLNVYLPIILTTALVVTVLLRAFVFRTGFEETEDGSKPKMSEAQKALGLGYAVPILAAAVAMIFGLVVYQVTQTNLQVWVWVIIQAIIGFGIIAGTGFAAKARAAKPAAPKPRTMMAAGASNLNFVLSIVFGAVVSIMAFTFGFAAIEKLRSWSEVPIDCKDTDCVADSTVNAITGQWLVEELLPAKVLLLLAVVGIYLSLTKRNKA